MQQHINMDRNIIQSQNIMLWQMLKPAYLQDIELDYPISVFVKGIESPCKRHNRSVLIHLSINKI